MFVFCSILIINLCLFICLFSHYYVRRVNAATGKPKQPRKSVFMDDVEQNTQTQTQGRIQTNSQTASRGRGRGGEKIKTIK
jgi:hypothetical protein